jgi:hypothetical protein
VKQANTFLFASGRFRVEDDSLKIVLDSDFCRYYKSLFIKVIHRQFDVQIPKYGAHINIFSPKIHKLKGLKKKYGKLHNRVVHFRYDPMGNFGGFSKGQFVNFWLDVHCPFAENLLKWEGFKKQGGFSLLHLTVFSTKGLTSQEISFTNEVCKKIK